MGLHLDALVIAAIGTASLAVVVLVSTLIFRFIHRRTSSPKSATASSPSSLVTKLFFSSPHTAQSLTFKSANTPVTASTDATLVTPTQGGRLKKSRTPTPGSGQSPDRPHPQPRPHSQRGLPAGAIPESVRDSEEIVMVTYEEGLARMGLRPHHILYADPPPFDQLSPRPSPPTERQDTSTGIGVPITLTMSHVDGWRTPGATPSTPGGAGIGTYRPSGVLGLGSSTRELVSGSSSRRSNTGHSEDLAGSPRTSPGRRQRRERERRRESGSDRRPTPQVDSGWTAGGGTVGSVWLPSYYQTTLARGVELPERDRPWDRPGGSGRI